MYVYSEYIFNEIKVNHAFPKKNDEFYDIVNTIFRLEETYAVEPALLANGTHSKQYPSRPLTG